MSCHSLYPVAIANLVKCDLVGVVQRQLIADLYYNQ